MPVCLSSFSNHLPLVLVRVSGSQERAELQAALDKEAEDRKSLESQQKALQQKLRSMEEKLIKGGEVISKASRQEALLREAENELRARQIQEATLARELAEKEEANLQLEEHFSSLQEEVEVKTKKLKKLWNKYQAALRETHDLQEEFQTERADMLDTIRQLTRTVKLKDVLLTNFVPEEVVKAIEKRAVYKEDEDVWVIPKMELAGSALQRAAGGGNAQLRMQAHNKLRRPETDFARQRKQFDNNPRFKYDNILNMDLDAPEKTTQEFMGPHMRSKVDEVLAIDMTTLEDQDVSYEPAGSQAISSPYLSYGSMNGGDTGDDRSIRNTAEKAASRPKTGKKRGDASAKVAAAPSGGGGGGGGGGAEYGVAAGSERSGASARPKSASRRRENDAGAGERGSDRGGGGYRGGDSYGGGGGAPGGSYQEDLYPTSRGLVRK